MSAAPQDAPAIRTPVLLIVAGATVSQPAINRAADLAAGAPVTVLGIGPPSTPSAPSATPVPSATEQVRRTVAQAMSVLEDSGVMSFGHIAVTSSPARAVVRVARARGARVVVLDQRGFPDTGRGGTDRLAAELRRRMYGSSITVVLTSGAPS